MRRSNALSRGSVVQMITALHRYLVDTAQHSVHPTACGGGMLAHFAMLLAFMGL
jgi:hypothetical protein